MLPVKNFLFPLLCVAALLALPACARKGGTDAGSVEFGGRAKVLKELIEHHAEEEEKEMFPRAKKLLSQDQLMELGSQMERRKGQLLGSPAR